MRPDHNTDLDSSYKHVLPDDAPYVVNLAALWAVDPKLARALEELHAWPSGLETEGR